MAEWVEGQILARVSDRRRYVEPFVGSAAVWLRVAPQFKEAVGSDAHPDLVLYLNALRDGWVPPMELTKVEYDSLRFSEPSALRGHVGFNCGFGGMWFRGWHGTAKDNRGVSRSRTAYNAALRDVPRLMACPPVKRMDYREVDVREGDTVYCDPPYNGTEEYSVSFCSYAFWGIAGRWVARGATVVVSEESAPDDWVIVSKRVRKCSIGYDPRTGERNPVSRNELIFVHESQVTPFERSTHKSRGWPAIE